MFGRVLWLVICFASIVAALGLVNYLYFRPDEPFRQPTVTRDEWEHCEPIFERNEERKDVQEMGRDAYMTLCIGRYRDLKQAEWQEYKDGLGL